MVAEDLYVTPLTVVMSFVFFRVSSWIVPLRWENEDDPRNHTNQTHEQNTPDRVRANNQNPYCKGFVASAPVRTSEVTQNSVTYYHVNDEANAQDVLNRATEFFSQRGCPITFQPPSTAPAMNNKPGTIHVDIYHSCQID